VLRGHRLEVWRLALLPDDKTLVSGCKDGTVCLWDTTVTQRHRPRITVPAKVSNWCFSADGRSLMTLDWEGQVARWSGPDFQEGEPGPNPGTNYTTSMFSPDARFLAVGSTNGNILVLDLSRGDLRREFKLGKGNVSPVSFLARGHRLMVWSATGNNFSEWDLDANRETQSWAAPAIFDPNGDRRLNGFSVSPDERLAIGVGWGGDLSARNLPDHGAMNLALDALEGSFVAFSSDGTRLAISSYLGYARVWDKASWREEATLRGFLNAVDSVAFSPDGKRLATGGTTPDDAVKLWDVDSWQDLLTLRGVGSLFEITAFSPDGNAIGTMSQDGSLSLWRAPSWEEINSAESKDKMGDQRP
jgi:WD40 repeat protein